MKISKQTFFVSLSVALLLAFTLVTGCVSNQAKLTDKTVRTPTENVNAFWDNKKWEELTKAEQELWSFVGYTETVWIGDEKNPPEADMYWNQLNADKRAALERMGYTESFWDDGDPE